MTDWPHIDQFKSSSNISGFVHVNIYLTRSMVRYPEFPQTFHRCQFMLYSITCPFINSSKMPAGRLVVQNVPTLIGITFTTVVFEDLCTRSIYVDFYFCPNIFYMYEMTSNNEPRFLKLVIWLKGCDSYFVVKYSNCKCRYKWNNFLALNNMY